MSGAASLPLVAIVGRPNVGKSTLFNRIVGDSRAAIVEDRARTTRDRIYGESEWNGRRFLVVDTGGLELAPGDVIEAKVQEQARLAIAEADLIVFVVEATAGLTPADQEAAETLRRATAPVFVAVNKADNARRELDAAEFWELGWDETWPISASHGRGVADLLDDIVLALPPEGEAELGRKAREVATDRGADLIGDELAEGLEPDEIGDAEEDLPGPVTIALVGRPNVGKSSLLNALLGEERAIVSAIPGTTRDAFDTRLPFGQGEIVLVDTAGIRRRGKVASGPAAERYSTLRALKAIDRADVTVLVIDAVEGLTAQDAHVAGYTIDAGKGLVIAVNKWDLVEDKTDRTFDQFVAWIRRDAAFLDLRPGGLDQRQDGPAGGSRAGDGRGRLGRAPQANRHRRAQPPPRRSDGPAGPAGGQEPPAEALLRNAGGDRAADVHLLRQRRRADPLQLPSLPREPDPRRARIPRRADPARLPQPGRRAPAPTQRRPPQGHLHAPQLRLGSAGREPS